MKKIFCLSMLIILMYSCTYHPIRLKSPNFKIFENRIVYSTNIDFEELKNSFNLYFRLSGINIKNNAQIFFITENKYNVSNYKIIDNNGTCYYLKNR